MARVLTFGEPMGLMVATEPKALKGCNHVSPLCVRCGGEFFSRYESLRT